MGSSELHIQQQMPADASRHQSHDQFQQLYCQQKTESQDSLSNSQPSKEVGDSKKETTFTAKKLSNNNCVTQDGEQAYSLSWKEFPTNFISFFKELKDSDELVDVTLACEGKQIAAHKVVLAASSPFFRGLLKSNPCQHPIVILNEVRYSELTPLLHYMYHGEVNVKYDQISNFLRTAKLLQVRGLTGETSEKFSSKSSNEIEKPSSDTPDGSPIPLNGPVKSAEAVERRCKTPEDRSQSPAPKRSKLSNSFGDSIESHVQSGDHSSPATISPPTALSNLATLPPMAGLSLPLSMPSIMPAVSSSLPIGLSTHGPTSLSHSGPFPHLFAPQYSHSDDASDTGASDPSEERPRLELEVDDDQENSLEKMSGLANMAALKGLAGFPGPSGLMGLTSGSGLGSNSDHSPGRPRFDFYRVRATDPRPCHLCGKIYKNAHTLRTHMEDKHSNCNGFRCVLCGTVAKSRNSLHSHMSRQHRGISTKDLPLLPMPAPWNPEIASKYIQLVGGVGEVVRQNYRRPDRPEGANGSDASTPTSQENGALSPYLKMDNDKDHRRSLDVISRQLDMNAAYGATKPPSASLLDTYLQMMRASGVDLMHGMQEKAWEDLRHNAAVARAGVLDLTRNTSSPSNFDDDDARGSDQYNSEDEFTTKDDKRNGDTRLPDVAATARSPEISDNDEEAKWSVQ